MTVHQSDFAFWVEADQAGDLWDLVSGMKLSGANAPTFGSGGMEFNGTNQYIASPAGAINLSDYATGSIVLLLEFISNPTFRFHAGIASGTLCAQFYTWTNSANALFILNGTGTDLNAALNGSLPSSGFDGTDYTLYMSWNEDDSGTAKGNVHEEGSGWNTAVTQTGFGAPEDADCQIGAGARWGSPDRYSNTRLLRYLIANRELTEAEMETIQNSGDPLHFWDLPISPSNTAKGADYNDEECWMLDGWPAVRNAAGSANQHLLGLVGESYVGSGRTDGDNNSQNAQFGPCLREALGASPHGLEGIGLTYCSSPAASAGNSRGELPPLTNLNNRDCTLRSNSVEPNAYFADGLQGTNSVVYEATGVMNLFGYFYDADNTTPDGFTECGLTDPWTLFNTFDFTNVKLHYIRNVGGGTAQLQAYVDESWENVSGATITAGAATDVPQVLDADLPAGAQGFQIGVAGEIPSLVYGAFSLKGSKGFRLGMLGYGGLEMSKLRDSGGGDDHRVWAAGVNDNEDSQYWWWLICTRNSNSAGEGPSQQFVIGREYLEFIRDNFTGTPPPLALVMPYKCNYTTQKRDDDFEAVRSLFINYALKESHDFWDVARSLDDYDTTPTYYPDSVHLGGGGCVALANLLTSKLELDAASSSRRHRPTRERWGTIR
jgi:hypothetical protein